jgi:hypothetical protein
MPAQILTFEQLVRHARKRRDSSREKLSQLILDDASADDIAAVAAVKATLKDFPELLEGVELRARLVHEATSRGMSRELLFPYEWKSLLSTSSPWKESTYYILGAMLLRRVHPKCKLSLFD